MSNQLFSVKSGKFHKPGEEITRANTWRPTKTACGLTVTPLNYFDTVAEADAYTGGRLQERHMCRHCERRGDQ